MAPGPTDAGVRDYAALSIPELEKLVGAGKKEPKYRAPMSARAVLEENRIAAMRRRAEKAALEQDLREKDLEMLKGESSLLKGDMDADKSRRAHAKVLSDGYREAIDSKLGARRETPQPEPEFFPFTGGEQLEVKRKLVARAQHAEFLAREPDPGKRAKHTPRRPDDPLQPMAVRTYEEKEVDPRGFKDSTFTAVYPAFLTKSSTYVTRMVNPQTQQAALAQKVSATFDKLQKDWEDKKAEDKNRSMGLHVNDNLEQEERARERAKNRANADALRLQIREARARRQAEDAERSRAQSGHFGPIDRKNQKDQLEAKNAQELLEQMATARARAEDLRQYDMEQDRLYAENQVKDLVTEREKEMRKVQKSHAVLRNSWAQQVKMRNVRSIVQSV
jgi:hypothetical protein